MRLVCAWTLRTSASCCSDVMPGLSERKSFPWRMTWMPSGARSAGMPAARPAGCPRLEDLLWILGLLRLRVLLGEGLGQVGLLHVERRELAAAAHGGVDEAVDVVVVRADDREADPRRAGRRLGRRRRGGGRRRGRGVSGLGLVGAGGGRARPGRRQRARTSGIRVGRTSGLLGAQNLSGVPHYRRSVSERRRARDREGALRRGPRDTS